MRPLWLKADSLLSITEEIALAFPLLLMQHPIEAAQRVKELGFDALILGLHEPNQEAKRREGSLDWLKSLKKEGLRLIAKPHSKKPMTVPFIDVIFWEYQSLFPSTEATQADLLIQELRWIEAQTPELIFYVPFDGQNPKRQAKALVKLAEEAGPKSAIAFSAHQGAPWQDFIPLHPFWEKVADCSETPLMPLLNTGLIERGESCRPNLPFELFDRCFSRCREQKLLHPIALANRLPGYRGCSNAGSGSGTQMALTGQPAELLSASWLKQSTPDLDFESWQRLMRQGREITRALKNQNTKKLCFRRNSSSEEAFFENRESGIEDASLRLSDYFFALASDAKGKNSFWISSRKEDFGRKQFHKFMNI